MNNSLTLNAQSEREREREKYDKPIFNNFDIPIENSQQRNIVKLSIMKWAAITTPPFALDPLHFCINHINCYYFTATPLYSTTHD